MRNFLNISRNFCKNRKGNLSIVAALALPTSLMAAFGALDYGMYTTSSQELKTAASMAALASINDAQIAYINREDVDFDNLIRNKATEVFNSRAADIKNTTLTNVEVVPEIINNKLSVEITYNAKVGSNIMGITGKDYYGVKNTQGARVAVRSYINFNFLFDVSASMGVGATHEDMVIMKEEINCAFSCHLRSERGNSTYDVAKAAGATMRIDIAREAAKKAIDVMIQASEVTDHMRVGLHLFDTVFSSHLQTSDPVSADLVSAKSKVDEYVQMRMEFGGSNMEGGLNKLVETLPTSGTGRYVDDRIEYIIVLTDGVENPQTLEATGTWYAHPDAVPNEPFKKFADHEYEYAPAASSCDTAKAKGINVFFINTEYLVPDFPQTSHNTDRFGFIEDTLHDLIPQRMAECAGRADNVFTATSPEEIITAFQEIIGEVSTPLRLY